MSSRRQFLKSATLATAAFAATPSVFASTSSGRSGNGGKKAPVRVIFLVSDGMSQGVFSMADVFSRQVRKTDTQFAKLMQHPASAKGLFECYSLESFVTDSAAAATAWGSGVRILNRGINTLADGQKLTPILPLIKDLGFGTGLVSTARVTHATPAGFAAAVAQRDSEEDIAPQYLDVVDVLLGGGTEVYDPKQRKDGEDLYTKFREKGYEISLSLEELRKAPKDKKILGLFAKGHLPYTVDHKNDPKLMADTPTLADMTAHALAVLEQNPQGFLLQVEGARIDHAAHSNDAAGILWDQLAFDDAVGVALEFQSRHPETLVVVTSDHGNSNPGLNGLGDGYADANSSFARIALAKASFDIIQRQFRDAGSDRDKPVSAEKAKAIVDGATGLELTLEDAELVARAHAGENVGEINVLHRRFSGILGQVLGNLNGVGWTGSQHTEDFTIITALGPGQDGYGKLIKNTDNFGIFCDLFGVTHKNPSLTLEESLKISKKTAQITEGRRLVDWA